jgi:hypothetical protein
VDRAQRPHQLVDLVRSDGEGIAADGAAQPLHELVGFVQLGLHRLTEVRAEPLAVLHQTARGLERRDQRVPRRAERGHHDLHLVECGRHARDQLAW